MHPVVLSSHRAVAAFCTMLAVLVLGSPSARAVHDPDVSAEEAKCQQATAKSLVKLGKAQAKCIVTCERGVGSGTVANAAECEIPFDGTTLACVMDGAADARSRIVSKCQADCPECYAGGCEDGSSAFPAAIVTQIANAVDVIGFFVYCSEDAEGCTGPGVPDACCRGSGTGFCGTVAERVCADATAKATFKQYAKSRTCFAKCRKREHSGVAAIGSCSPDLLGNVTDPVLQACLTAASERAARAIDAKCEGPGNDKPDDGPPVSNCGAYNPYAGTAGTSWGDFVKGIASVVEDPVFCGSASGAFLE